MPRLQHPLSSTFGNYDFSMLSLSSAVIWIREKEQRKVKEKRWSGEATR
jgi:hypothetical protein